MKVATVEERARRRFEVSLGASLLVHVLLAFLVVHAKPLPPPEEQVIELAVLRTGDPDKPPGPPPGSEDTPKPRPRTADARHRQRSSARPTPTGPPLAPDGQHVAMVNPGPPMRQAPEPAPSAPVSFRDWQRSRASSWMPSGTPSGFGGGGGVADGHDGLDVRERDRCEPPAGRTFQVLYLLFDSSGSMSPIRKSEALSCAQQYANAAIAAGASVVVGNFANGTHFTGPTRELLDIQAALRITEDASATILPARDLQPFLDKAPDETSELVIVSDGMFANSREVLVWYRYFLELNRENRGTMYTVGTPGYRQSVGELRQIGFDVYMYEQIHAPAEKGKP